MPSEAIKLERERRKSAREEKAWALAEKVLGNAAVLEPAGIAATMLLTYKAGKERVINRDIAGAMFALEGVLAAARYGVHDRFALMGLWATLAAAYSATVRPTEGEALITLEPIPSEGWEGGVWSDIKTALLGSDQKLFMIPMP